MRFKPPDNDPFPDIIQFLEKVYSNRMKRLGDSKERVKGVCGIIYCSTRNQCDEVAQMLRQKSIRAACYHAGLTPKQRKEILESWTDTDALTNEQNEKMVDIVVATVSFGMGIDKQTVRFVIHWDMPKSFEGYYQESGRAGRDNKVSRCILYYSRQDRDRSRFLLGQAGERPNVQDSFEQVNLIHLDGQVL